ncbi:MAG: ROK family protein, partial [Pseudomonadota bacterium]
MSLALGIDLGGTKIEIIALDENGIERLRRRAPTPPEYDGTFRAIKELVETAEN